MAKDQQKVQQIEGHKGIYFLEHPARKLKNNKPDKKYIIRYMYNGKRRTSHLGWQSDGWNIGKAVAAREELLNNAQSGTGTKTYRENLVENDNALKQQVEEAKIQKQQEYKENITFSDYFEKIYYPELEQYSTNKPRTIQNEKYFYENWYRIQFGHLKLTDVSEINILKLRKQMFDLNRKKRTFEYCLTVLKKVFKHAESKGYLTNSIPIKKDHKVKYDNKRVRFLSHDEAHLLLETLKSRCHRVYEMSLLSLLTGMRAGEIFNLKFKDIDFVNDSITILDTKNKQNRIVFFPEQIKEILISKNGKKPDELVFPSEKNTKIVNISKTFFKIVDELGFNNGIDDNSQKIVFHSLRHTFASWLVQNGTPLYSVQKLLGHNSITMTERYAHLAPDNQKIAANLISDIFNEKTVDDSNDKKIVNFPS